MRRSSGDRQSIPEEYVADFARSVRAVSAARWRTWSRAADADKISDSRYDEHLAIIEALRRRDPDAAEIAARAHVTNALRDILKVLLDEAAGAAGGKGFEMEVMTTALEGVKVLDFTEYGAGPFCSMMLGDLGADIIKVEPPRGDALRQWGPMQEGMSAPFFQLNRNKRSVVLDLKDPRDQERARELACRSDVLIENFRPGTMEKLGLHYPALRELTRA